MQKTIDWYLNKGFSQKMAEYFVSGRRTIINVKPKKDFSLILLFDNNEKKIFDMKNLIQPNTVFDFLLDWNNFSRVYLDSDSIVSWDKNPNIDSNKFWSNKVDLSTDSLYVDSVNIND